MLKIAITGSNGLVGSRVVELLGSDFTFVPISHTDVDVTNRDNVSSFLSQLDYDILLHMAAYTNVEGAESEKEKAHMINVEGTRNVFEAVHAGNKKMIYISTDFVFDGTHPPYDEESEPHPLGYYALTKYEGEQIVKDKAMIVRISYPYGNRTSSKPDFAARIKQLLSEGKELTMMTDATITPTFIDDIAYSIKYLMNHFEPTIYHVVGAQSLSPFDAGKIISGTFGLPQDLIKPTTYAEYSKGKAPRPQYSSAVSKKNTFHKMRTFEEGIKSL